MSNADLFSARAADDVGRIVADYPLSWLYTSDSRGPFATAVPVRPNTVDGQLYSLIGHIPRHGRVAAAVVDSPDALILIQGPHGYVSPSWFSNRAQAPTWNYIAAQFVVDVNLKDDASVLDAHLRDLTVPMERNHCNAWQVDELGQRLETLSSRIIAFEAVIRGTESRFKLGQDENDQTFSEIIRAIEVAGNDQLVAWMREYNPGRSDV